MRLFTAIDLPDAVRTSYADLQSDLQAVLSEGSFSSEDEAPLDVRWSAPERFHVTIRFIGEADTPAFTRYRDALAEVQAEPFSAAPYGLDVLPSRRAPRVLTLGLPTTDPLKALYAEVSRVLEDAGLEPESRNYRPHVTLGRFSDADARHVHRFLRAADLPDFDAWPVCRFHLYESTLGPDGAEHEVQATYSL